MVTVICSLYEGSYAIGLGALINSLYKNNFKGNFYFGYKGDLPKWLNSNAITKINDTKYDYNGSKIHFIKLDTERHLTNFKPEFMSLVLQKYEPNTEAIFYFDPDICVKCDWSFFERWANHGVALCEDINSPMPISHPIRKDWEVFFNQLKFNNDIYVNGGFIGIQKSNLKFLDTWIDTQNKIEAYIGNLNTWNIDNRTYIFQKTDQDALNISIHLYHHFKNCSIIGKEAMDFIEGGYIMSHALAQPKPWDKNFIFRSLLGFSPNKSDKLFFLNLNNPIKVKSSSYIFFKKLSIKVAKVINKFIS